MVTSDDQEVFELDREGDNIEGRSGKPLKGAASLKQLREMSKNKFMLCTRILADRDLQLYGRVLYNLGKPALDSHAERIKASHNQDGAVKLAVIRATKASFDQDKRTLAVLSDTSVLADCCLLPGAGMPMRSSPPQQRAEVMFRLAVNIVSYRRWDLLMYQACPPDAFASLLQSSAEARDEALTDMRTQPRDNNINN